MFIPKGKLYCSGTRDRGWVLVCLRLAPSNVSCALCSQSPGRHVNVPPPPPPYPLHREQHRTPRRTPPRLISLSPLPSLSLVFAFVVGAALLPCDSFLVIPSFSLHTHILVYCGIDDPLAGWFAGWMAVFLSSLWLGGNTATTTTSYSRKRRCGYMCACGWD